MVFNPDVPKEQDKNFWYWSKPIKDPNFVAPTGQTVGQTIHSQSGDESTGVGLKGAADLFSKGATAWDEYNQSAIKTEAYDKASAARSDYTARLERTADAMGGKASTAGAPLDLISEGAETDVPAPLEGLPTQLGQYSGARANGKISETYYYMTLDKLASDMRSRYPGYRDYIDKEFEKVTGVQPANAVVKSLIGDINAASAKMNSEQNKAMTLATQNIGIPGMEEMARKVHAGQAGLTDVIHLMAPFAKQELQWKMNEGFYNNDKRNRDHDKTNANDAINQDAGERAIGLMNRGSYDNGQGQGPLAIRELVEKAAKGQNPLTDEEWRQVAINLRQQRNQEFAAAVAKYSTPIGPGKPSMSTLAGTPDEVNKLITGRLQPLDNMIDAIENKQYGLAYSHALQAEAIKHDSQYALLNNKQALYNKEGKKVGTLGDYFRDMIALEKDTPTAAMKLSEGYLGTTLQADIARAVREGTLRAVTQPTLDKPKDSTSIRTEINNATSSMGDSPGVDKKKAEVSNHLIANVAGVLKDPKMSTTTKTKAAVAAFGPDNQGLIRDIIGNVGKGKVYSELTTPEMAAEVQKLGKPVWEMYKRWTTDTFGLEIVPSELNNVGKLQSYFTEIRNKDKAEITWDNKNYRLGVDQGDQKNINLGNYRNTWRDPHMNDAVATVNRLNTAIQSLVTIAKKEGSDPNAYVLGVLQGTGMDLKMITGAMGTAATKPEPKPAEKK